MTDDTSFPENVSVSFQRLMVEAAELNAVSDALGKSISSIDAALKPLNLGIETWVPFAETGFDTGFETRYIGYAKIDAKWGVALRVVAGDHNAPEYASCAQWLFNDAPRTLRIEAVDKLSQLLEGLIETTRSTTKQIGDKIGHAQRVVEAVAKAAPQPAVQRKK